GARGPAGPRPLVAAPPAPAPRPPKATWYLVTNRPRPGGPREAGSPHPAAPLAEITRIYGIRHWIEQGYKQVKDELGWADFQVRSDIAIRRHQVLVNCAFTFCWASWFADHPPQHDPAPPRPEPGRGERGATPRLTAPGTALAPGATRDTRLAHPLDRAAALVASMVQGAPAATAASPDQLGRGRLRPVPLHPKLTNYRYQPGVGSQSWALQCCREHEDQIPSAMPMAPAGSGHLGVPSIAGASPMLAETQDDQEIIARVAALDIGKAELVCCVRVPDEDRPGRRLQEVETYATMTRPLLGLADRLACLGVTRVVMEATSDYVRREGAWVQVGGGVGGPVDAGGVLPGPVRVGLSPPWRAPRVTAGCGARGRSRSGPCPIRGAQARRRPAGSGGFPAPDGHPARPGGWGDGGGAPVAPRVGGTPPGGCPRGAAGTGG